MSSLLTTGLILLGSTGVQAKSVSEKGISLEHGDWEVACDNTGTCRAAGYQAEDSHSQSLSVLLTRKAGAGQRVTSELKLGTIDDDESQQIPESVYLWINGKNFGSVGLSSQQTYALINALTKKSVIEFKSGKKVWNLSDVGAAAVLLKMDAVQGRVGTTGALIKKGKNSEANVFKPLPMPVVNWIRTDTKANASPDMQRLFKNVDLKQLEQDLVKDQIAIQQRNQKNDIYIYTDECPVLNGEDKYAKFDLEVEPLSNNKLLASGLCWRGAYNSGAGYWLINAKKPYQPQLITTGASDYSNGIIRANQKGRGLGDCYSNDEWTWNGNQFIQTHAATTGMCKMVELGGTWDLPTKVALLIKANEVQQSESIRR